MIRALQLPTPHDTSEASFWTTGLSSSGVLVAVSIVVGVIGVRIGIISICVGIVVGVIRIRIGVICVCVGIVIRVVCVSISVISVCVGIVVGVVSVRVRIVVGVIRIIIRGDVVPVRSGIALLVCFRVDRLAFGPRTSGRGILITDLYGTWVSLSALL